MTAEATTAQTAAAHKRVLLLIDIQTDFLPGGALAVPEGDAIIAPVRKLMSSDFFAVAVATQDWHPAGHVSFASSHPGRAPFETIELGGHEQVLWPDHCVQGTPGAALDARLPWDRVRAIIRKGTDPAVDSYSGFRNNYDASNERPPTGLAGYLHELGATELYLCGLARDVCVAWTAADAADLGFTTFVIWDCTRPVDPGSDASVREDLTAAGVGFVDAGDLPTLRRR